MHSLEKNFRPLFFYEDLNTYFKDILLIINKEEYPLIQLMNEKKILIERMEDNIHVTITNIRKIKEIKDTENNFLELKIIHNHKTMPYGVLLTEISGYNPDACWGYAFHLSELHKLPISANSKNYHLLFDQYKTGAEPKTYSHTITVKISGTITNFFN